MHFNIKEPIRLLFLIHDPSRTGAPLVALSTMERLRQDYPCIEFDTLLLSDNDNGIKDDFHKISDVFYAWNIYSKWERRAHKYLRRPLNSAKWERFLFKRKYDLIIANTVVCIDIAYKIKVKFGIPIVLWCHEAEVACQCMNVTERKISICDFFICPSDSVKSCLMRRSAPENKIIVIPPISTHIVSLQRHSPLYKKANQIFTIGFSGGRGWTKGGDILPLIISRLHQKYPQLSCQYVWSGSVPLDTQQEIEHDLQMMGAPNTIHFTGKVADIIPVFQECDIFLILSREESFSMVAIENALIGNPLIIFKGATGLEDTFKDGESALYVPYLDIDAVCDAIYSLYSNPHYREELSKNGKLAANALYKAHNPISEFATAVSLFLGR